MEPIDEANTSPNPIANGPPIFKNFSDGAVAAIALKPPTAPAVYQAALTSVGPPSIVKGAKKAPIIPACSAQAKCFELNLPDSYGRERTSICEPIVATKNPTMLSIELRVTKFMIAAFLEAATAEAAVTPRVAPKYSYVVLTRSRIN